MGGPSLAQLWGPRYQVYVVPKRDFALFSLARLPEDEKGRLTGASRWPSGFTHISATGG